MAADLSSEDFTAISEALSGGDDAPAFDLPDVGGDRHPDDDRWTVKPKGDAEPTVEQELESNFDKLTSGAADDSAWQREQRRLADEALRAAGVDPARRHEAGISRREATRRLFRAEAMLREDPAGGFAALVSSYGGTLEPAQRAQIAAGVLQRLGFQTPGAISEAERSRLRSYDERSAAERREYEATLPAAAAMIREFAGARPNFDALRPTMCALIRSGDARDLASAYDLACKVRGVPTSTEAAAKAADEARRSKVASAKAAGSLGAAVPVREG